MSSSRRAFRTVILVIIGMSLTACHFNRNRHGHGYNHGHGHGHRSYSFYPPVRVFR